MLIHEMRDELGTKKIDEVLQSHCLPPEPDGPLLTDDFDCFLDWRRLPLALDRQQCQGGLSKRRVEDSSTARTIRL